MEIKYQRDFTAQGYLEECETPEEENAEDDE